MKTHLENLKKLLSNSSDRTRVISLSLVSLCFLIMTIILSYKMPQTKTEKQLGEISSTSTSSTQSKEPERSSRVNSEKLDQDKSTAWVANDYLLGDIKGENYTIVKGDTLWEIAESKYGSGFEYQKIIEKNPDKVHLFEDGRIGLIFVGDTLIL